MNNYILKILNNEEEFIIKNVLSVYTYFDNIYKMPMWYGPKDKFITDNLVKHDFETIYCINNIKYDNNFYGVSYENFINKNYCVLYVSFKFYNKSFMCYNYGNYISHGIVICGNIHDEILLHLQNTYILLKQMFDFTDINQYMLKIYANVIL